MAHKIRNTNAKSKTFKRIYVALLTILALFAVYGAIYTWTYHCDSASEKLKGLDLSYKESNYLIESKKYEEGKKRQETIRSLLCNFREATQEKIFKNRETFQKELREIALKSDMHLSAVEIKMITNGLSESDETADVCLGRGDKPESDADL